MDAPLPAKSLKVEAVSKNNLETISVSGTDPIARSADTNSTCCKRPNSSQHSGKGYQR